MYVKLNVLSNVILIHKLNFCKDFSHIIYFCENLINIDLSSFCSKNPSGTRFVFYGCVNLEKIDLSVLNTKNIINKQIMS